jgi:hypothetical protein
VDPSDEEAIRRHVRGATVVHQSPFSSIEVPQIKDLLSTEEIEKWVVPFYRVSFANRSADFMLALKAIYQEITLEIVNRLFSDYNWRPRITAAFFASLKRYESLEEHIGKLLLRSDLCFAGKQYCVALAEFNTLNGIRYLTEYLDYYLTRPDLDYDQGDAMAAIAYLDEKNKTDLLTSYKPLLESYAQNKPYMPELNKCIERFKRAMDSLHQCRAELEPNGQTSRAKAG